MRSPFKNALAVCLGLLASAPTGALAVPPTIVLTAPASADEGDAITLVADVTDDDGDTPTWSWDLDGDGVYGDLPDTIVATIDAGTTDGPATRIVGVLASDGTENATAMATIMVVNLPPTITSEPPLTAAVRELYRYTVAVEDPGGAADPLTILLTSRPTGMTIAGELLEWTPTPDQRGQSLRAIVRVDDGDDGETMQSWTIDVAPNQPPGPAEPVSPVMRTRVAEDTPVTLVVMNASDVEGDPLSYVFDLSRTSSFDPDGELISSDAIPEGADGMTRFETAEPLGRGLWYWRVRANDGAEDGPATFAQLVVGEGVSVIDAGPDAGSGGGGGCTIGAGGTPRCSPVSMWLCLIAAARIAARRRR